MVVSPSHQYPLGSVMSLARRRALLATAHATDAWIVEDDYDSEFRYGSRPLPSLQGLDEGGRVLYMGTFSKVLFPSLRIGYLVVPPALADAEIPPMLIQPLVAALLESGRLTAEEARRLPAVRSAYAGVMDLDAQIIAAYRSGAPADAARATELVAGPGQLVPELLGRRHGCAVQPEPLRRRQRPAPAPPTARAAL